ncbi:MAG TPA: hypothetical protein VH540_08490 [Ktedonobacterales bacterium]
MQQAPGYQDQELRRDYSPMDRPAVPGTTPTSSGAAPAEYSTARTTDRATMAWRDWVRWGPIWAGLLTIVATLAVMGALGAAIAFSVWGANPNNAFVYGWSILTGIVAYLLGGWMTARTAGVTGVRPAVLNAAMAWALSLAALFVLTFVSAGRTNGLMGGVAPGLTAPQTATASWITFVTLVIGLILAMIGGAIGSRRLEWGR